MLHQVSRRAQQHRGVPVMSAGMHLAGHGRAMLAPREFLDIQRIQIGAQPDRAPTRPVAPERRDHAGRARCPRSRPAPMAQAIRDQRAVRFSSKPISGWRWMSRRIATSSGSNGFRAAISESSDMPLD